PMPFGDVLHVLQQMGNALDATHRAGIIHRDLKPENVFICRSNVVGLPFMVKVVDFGIAKVMRETMVRSATRAIGSPMFMSPEQARIGGQVGPYTDVWAMGLIAFYALTARHFWRTAYDPEGNYQRLDQERGMSLPPASGRARELNAVALPPGFD